MEATFFDDSPAEGAVRWCVDCYMARKTCNAAAGTGIVLPAIRLAFVLYLTIGRSA